MTVDRGGMRYGIQVTDGFSRSFGDFINSTQQAKAAWESLKAALSQSPDTKGLKAVTQELKRTESEERKATSARRKGKEELTLAEEAARKYQRTLRRTRVDLGVIKISEQERNDALKTLTRTLKGKREAENAVSKILRERVQLQRRANEVYKLGAKLSEEETIKLGLASRVKRQLTRETQLLAAAKKRLADITLSSNNAELRSLQAQTRISNLVNKQRSLLEDRQKLVSQGFDFRGRELPALGALTPRQATQLGIASKLTRDLTVEQKELKKANDSLAKSTEVLNNRQLLNIEAQAKANQIAAREQKRILTNENLARLGLDPKGKPLPVLDKPVQQQRTIEFFKNLGTQLQKTDFQANRISFTFRRLIGILAAFAVARVVARSFADLLRQTVSLNAAIETTTLGIASLVGSIGDVFTLAGEPATAAERLNIAFGVARDQVNKLRVDALSTTATFDELASAFQNALAPGLRAGLNVDQIRQFSRQISIAATAVGLEQRQLAEEVRSLLSATIRPQNTRIATFLGITNQDIRNATRAGRLFEFLQERFEVFDQAGSLAAQTFTGLVQRIRGGLQTLLEFGGLEFFNRLKAVLSDVFDTLVTIDPITRNLQVNPELLKVVQILSEGLTVILNELVRIGSVITASDLQQLAVGFVNLSSAFSSVFGGIIEGIILGLRDVSNLLQNIRIQIVETLNIDIFSGSFLRNISAQATRILTISIAIGLAVRLIVFAIAPVKLIIIGIVAAAVSFLQTMIKIGGATVSLTKSFAALRLSTLAFSKSLIPVLAGLGAVVLLVTQLTGLLDLTNTEFGIKGGRFLNDVKELAKFVGTVVNPFASLEDVNAQASKLKASLDANKELQKEQLKTKDTFEEAFGNSFERLGEKITSVFAASSDAIDQFTQSSDESLDEVEGIVLSLSTAVQELQSEFEELAKQARVGQLQAQDSEKLLGLEQSISAVVSRRLQASREAAEKTREVQQTIVDNLRAINRIETELLRTDLTEGQTEKLKANIKALEFQIDFLNQEIEKTETLLSGIAASDALSGLLEANFDSARQNALLRIEATRSRAVALAERERNSRKKALAELTFELETLTEQERQREETVNKTQQAIAAEIALRKEQIALLESVDPEDLIGTGLENQLQVERNLLRELETRSQKLEEELFLQREIAQASKERLLTEEAITRASLERPVLAGLLQGVIESFDEASNLFQVTLDVMRNAVQGFSDFVAQSIVDAFDPTTDTSIQERFARFLQSIAKQIIATMVQLAVTAAVLNAASGGLLGPFLRNLSAVQGFGAAEGGNIGDLFAEHQRRNRKFRYARGLADGGSPVARSIPNVPRPKGLDPRDKIAAWLDPSEWVIRGSSVAKAGADALDRINRGLFDPRALRDAVGLRGWRRSSVVAAKTSRGLAEGGPASTVRQPSSASGGGSSANAPGIAIIAPTPQAAENLLRNGQDVLLRILAENGIYPAR